MEPLEPDKWQSAYSENNGYDDSIKRSGSLLVPVILALVIPFFYLIFYTFKLLITIPAGSNSITQFVIHISPSIVVAILMIIFLIVAITFIKSTARSFLQIFYDIPESTDVKTLVSLRIFGKIPTPPPLSKIVKFSIVKVKNGKLDTTENWHTIIGGPVKLLIEPGNAVYLERGDVFSRVVGQGAAFLDVYERIKVVVNLGPHMNTFETGAWTKDGIRVELKVKGKYFLGSLERNINNENLLIPFDAEAVRKSVEQTIANGKEGHEWLEGAIGKTKGVLNEYIASQVLEEIFKENKRLFTKATINKLLEGINKKLQDSGVSFSDFQITEASTHDHITKERLNLLTGASYKYNEIVVEGEIKAHQIRERERARAQTQRNLIYTLASGLDRIDATNFPEPLFLSVAALLDQSIKDPSVRSMLGKEILETLEKTQESLKFNLQNPSE